MAAKTARAVRPNAGVERWYRDRLQELIRQMAQSMLVHIRASYKAGGFANDARNPSLTLARSMKRWGDLWSERLERMAAGIAERFADKNFSHAQASMREAFKEAGWTVAFKPTMAAKVAYQAVIMENVNLIKSIPAQYLKDTQTAVWNSVMRGGDLSTLTKTIEGKYGVAHRRAALIARDQNAKAKAVIENVRRQELGITEAIWMHSGGGKEPRPTHVAMNGERYKLKEGMFDRDENKHVWPGELINCRCVSKSVIPGFS